MTDLYPCAGILHVAIPVSAETCAAARAAIRAAEIQGKATRHAGSQGIIAGAMALLAGALAFWGALLESRRLNHIETAKRRAYSIHLSALLTPAFEELRDVEAYVGLAGQVDADDVFSNIGFQKDPTFDVTYLAKCRDALGYDKWHEFGNLPDDGVAICVSLQHGINESINVLALIVARFKAEAGPLSRMSHSDIEEIGRGRDVIRKASANSLSVIRSTLDKILLLKSIIDRTYGHPRNKGLLGLGRRFRVWLCARNGETSSGDDR